MTNIQNIVSELKEKGITSNLNWLSSDEISFIKNHTLKLNKKKGDKQSHLPISNFSFFLKLAKIQFRDVALGLYLKNLSKKLQLNEISNQYFNAKSKLVNMDFYVSKKSNSPVLDWHVDKAYSGRKDVSNFVKAEDFGLKFIFYLTDVTFDNGCLKYIPFSNKIAFALKKGIFNKEIQYSPYWKVSDFSNLVKLNENIVLKYVDKESLHKFYEFVEKLGHTQFQKKFSHEIQKGGAVIFDESGVHKGTEPKYNDRLIFRYIFKKDGI